MTTEYVMLLNDGEAFTDLNGCKIVEVELKDKADVNELEELISNGDYVTVREFASEPDVINVSTRGKLADALSQINLLISDAESLVDLIDATERLVLGSISNQLMSLVHNMRGSAEPMHGLSRSRGRAGTHSRGRWLPQALRAQSQA